MLFQLSSLFLEPMSYQPLSVDVSFSWHASLEHFFFLRPASLLIWLELVIFESWQRFSC
jgi:hypothetical protein